MKEDEEDLLVVFDGTESDAATVVNEVSEKMNNRIPKEEISKMITDTTHALRDVMQYMEKEYTKSLQSMVTRYHPVIAGQVILSMPVNGLKLFLEHINVYSESFHTKPSKSSFRALREEINKILDDFEGKNEKPIRAD